MARPEPAPAKFRGEVTISGYTFACQKLDAEGAPRTLARITMPFRHKAGKHTELFQFVAGLHGSDVNVKLTAGTGQDKVEWTGTAAIGDLKTHATGAARAAEKGRDANPELDSNLQVATGATEELLKLAGFILSLSAEGSGVATLAMSVREPQLTP